MPPCVERPRSVCVVIGPFIGWNVVAIEPLGRNGADLGMLSAVTTSSGLPRFQARLSKSPKMWQLEHDASPFPDVSCASYRNLRPVTTLAGSGLLSACDSTVALVVGLIT